MAGWAANSSCHLSLGPIRKYFVLSSYKNCVQDLRTLNNTWRRQWHPTPVLLLGKFHGQRNLVGCSPWDFEESDTTERLHFHFSLSCIGEGNGNPSSVLAWRIPGTEEPGRLPSLGSHRVRHDWSDLAAAAAVILNHRNLLFFRWLRW